MAKDETRYGTVHGAVLRAIAAACSTERRRYSINAICLLPDKGGLRVWATDGRMGAEVIFKGCRVPFEERRLFLAADILDRVKDADSVAFLADGAHIFPRGWGVFDVNPEVPKRPVAIVTYDPSMDGSFPNMDEVNPGPEETPEVRGSFNPVLFGKAMALAESLGLKCMTIRHGSDYANDKPLNLTGTTGEIDARIMVMPMRVD